MIVFTLLTWHWVRPEEVVVEGGVGVGALRGVEQQQLVDQVARAGVPHVRAQPAEEKGLGKKLLRKCWGL